MKANQISKRFLIARNLFIILFVSLGSFVLGFFSAKPPVESAPPDQSTITLPETNEISWSPSQKYKIRFKPDNSLEIVTPEKPIDLVPVPVKGDGYVFDFGNIAWSQDEKTVIVSYIKDFNDPAKKTAVLAFYTTGGDKIAVQDMGKQGFYDTNYDRAFSPMISPDGKYIAIQADLIHSIAIYDLSGRLITKQPTVYRSTPLNSEEMYQLDQNTYSPLLVYEWSADSKSLSYHFAKSMNSPLGEIRIDHEMDLSRYLH